MNTTTCQLSFASLLFATAPLLVPNPEPTARVQDAGRAASQDLERTTRETLGGVVDQKAKELADRVRGHAGDTSNARADDEDSDESDDTAADPLIDRLTRIEDRLSNIESLLCDMSTRSVPLAPSSAAGSSLAAPIAAAVPAATIGAPVTDGFARARIRSWHHGHDATIKLSINGLPAGRFDTDSNLDLDQLLKPGRSNQLAFTIEPHGKSDAAGMEIWVEAMMPGSDDFVALLKFKATKDRVADTLEIPVVPR